MDGYNQGFYGKELLSVVQKGKRVRNMCSLLRCPKGSSKQGGCYLQAFLKVSNGWMR